MSDDATPADSKVDAAASPQPGADDTTTNEALVALGDKYLRLAADFDNFRKRKAQEMSDSATYSAQAAVVALLPAIDNLRRAVAAESSGEALREGVVLVIDQFDAALTSLGVVPVPSVGAPFDPAVHQALMAEEGGPDVTCDTVVEELQRGYLLFDRLIRPALVKVAHPPVTPKDATDSAQGSDATDVASAAPTKPASKRSGKHGEGDAVKEGDGNG